MTADHPSFADERSEQALIAAALHLPEAAKAAAAVPADAWTDPAYGEIAAAIGALVAAGTPVDDVTVAGALRDRDVYDSTGGDAMLCRAEAALPDVRRFDVYRRRILELYARRLAVTAAVAGDWRRVQQIAARALEVLGAPA